ncbi:endonuclease SmrB [Bowmanella dokdonensis]|uniref:Ribosome rescue factor SmrB n=1 Tax=Bowmanella dokdonensis TaxID=751969 RepID=A0A939ITG9_9ALTE|nr:endonuclease SmrB [Bowmanella dokdonensis]MBN7827446.1 endonuclease SmrB [Bowmanella dokdonensis]
MTKKPQPDEQDLALFRQAIRDVKPMRQDTLPEHASPEDGPLWYRRLEASDNIHSASVGNKQKSAVDRQKRSKPEHRLDRQAAASFQFSDGFEAWFDPSQPLKYVQPGSDSHELKRLRRGDYPPDLILDLHGLRREDAKMEIAALLHAARKQHCACVCIVHGLGEHVLKRSVPNWLIQHPDVLAFHQAPLEWGGRGALLVLLRIQ